MRQGTRAVGTRVDEGSRCSLRRRGGGNRLRFRNRRPGDRRERERCGLPGDRAVLRRSLRLPPPPSAVREPGEDSGLEQPLRSFAHDAILSCPPQGRRSDVDATPRLCRMATLMYLETTPENSQPSALLGLLLT